MVLSGVMLDVVIFVVLVLGGYYVNVYILVYIVGEFWG